MPDRRDRVADWKDELRRLMPTLMELPPPARKAVVDVLTAFAREDADDSPLHLAAWPGHEARS
jgi:hypothetical protein